MEVVFKLRLSSSEAYHLVGYFFLLTARTWHAHTVLTKCSKFGGDSNQEISLSDGPSWSSCVNKLLNEGRCCYKSICCIVYGFLSNINTYYQSHILYCNWILSVFKVPMFIFVFLTLNFLNKNFFPFT